MQFNKYSETEEEPEEPYVEIKTNTLNKRWVKTFAPGKISLHFDQQKLMNADTFIHSVLEMQLNVITAATILVGVMP